jgi:hypothetical protein
MTLPHTVPQSLPNIHVSPDMIIISVVLFALLYGLLLGQHKIKTFALSVYVGIVIANELGQMVYGLLTRNHWNFHGALTPGEVRLALFMVPILLLEIGRRERRVKSHEGGMGLTIILAVLTSALVLSSALSLLDPATRRPLVESSFLATELYNLRIWWILAVPVVVIGKSLMRHKE